MGLEQEIGVQQPKYDAFYALLNEIREKRNTYLTKMQGDIRDCNRRIAVLEKDLAACGQRTLAAQIAGDTAAVEENDQAVVAINAEIASLRQRVSNYSKVDINSMLFGDLGQLRIAMLEAVAESRQNVRKISNYISQLERQREELKERIHDSDILRDKKRYAEGNAYDYTKGLLKTMYSEHPKRDDLLNRLNGLMGMYSSVQIDTSRPFQEQIEDILSQYGK